MSRKISVTKSSGQKAPFSLDKLKRSLRRAGASEETVHEISRKVIQHLFEGISTRKIYKLAFSLLKHGINPQAARYRLKEAIMELGPSGFPFEIYISRILQHKGFSTQTGVIGQGICVSHEIDVLAIKNNLTIFVECKYHNNRGVISDVKVPMYVYSRFKDLEAKYLTLKKNDADTYGCYLYTNTRFSEDARKYGSCMGLKLFDWDYPERESLRDQVESTGLYPLTCLSSITITEKKELLSAGMVLARELLRQESLLVRITGRKERLGKIMREVETLCLLS